MKFTTAVKTRFVSRHGMLGSLLAQKATVNHCFHEIAPEKYRCRQPTHSEWTAAEQFYKTLDFPAKVVMKTQDKGHWTLADAALRVAELEDHFKIMANDVPDSFIVDGAREDNALWDSMVDMVTRVSTDISTALEPFVDVFRAFDPERPHMPLAVLLDPRERGGIFVIANGMDKHKAIRVARQYEELLFDLAAKGAKYLADLEANNTGASIQRTASTTPLASTGASAPAGRCSHVIDLFSTQDFSAYGHATNRPTDVEARTRVRVKDEMATFRALERAMPDTSPIEWWKKHSKNPDFTNLAFVAKQIFGIPGSAIECERVFSAAGILTALLRNRMSPERIHQVIFILKNYPFDRELSRLWETEKTMKRFKKMALADDASTLISRYEEEEDGMPEALKSVQGDEEIEYTGLHRVLEAAGMLEEGASGDGADLCSDDDE